MKKNLYLILFAFTLNISSGLCTVVTIHNVGFTFSSDAVTIILGDTVVFSINNIHFAKEVSQATWNIDDSVSNGGFQTPFGGGTVILDSVKTYYYVCGKHFDMGMKGTITVTDPTGIKPVSNSIPTLEVFPNPASKWLPTRAWHSRSSASCPTVTTR